MDQRQVDVRLLALQSRASLEPFSPEREGPAMISANVKWTNVKWTNVKWTNVKWT
jgi:hypothetical protein